MRRSGLSTVAVLFTFVSLLSGADEPAAPKTHTIEAAPFYVVVELPGVFEAASSAEVRLEPKSWSKLEVVKAVPQGARVAVGDPLLWLKTEDLDEAIADAELASVLAKLSLEEGLAELKSLEVSVPLDLAAAERAQKEADEDLAYYQKVGEELSRKTAEDSLKRSQEQVEYAQEELDQLEKMYKADDLTEETEEIILLRTRRDLEHSKFFAEAAQHRLNHDLQIDLPRQRVQTENAAVRAAIAFERARATLPASLQQKRIDVKKLTLAAAKADENLADLKADRELMTVKSPAAGIVRYGECERGKWTNAAEIEGQLREGGKVVADMILFTIVSGERMQIRVEIPEDKLHLCTPGKTGTAIPKGFPKLRLAATLDEVNLIALREGVFDGRISYTGDAPQITAGMSCTVKLTASANERALSVPTSAIFSEPGNDEVQSVYVVVGEGSEKRSVKTGHEQGDRTEILEGLKAGEKILLEKPAN